jgi:hypothetical protein
MQKMGLPPKAELLNQAFQTLLGLRLMLPLKERVRVKVLKMITLDQEVQNMQGGISTRVNIWGMDTCQLRSRRSWWVSTVL